MTFFPTFYRGILMDPLAIKAAEATLETAFKHRNEIITALNALKRVAQGKLTVAIFGIGGTGKTTAQLLLTEGIDKSNKNLAYVPTVRPNKKSAKDNMFVTIWDTPGQDDFRESAWDTALASIQKSHRAVLINVVSYGHNSAGVAPFSELRKRSLKHTKDEIIRNYFRLERKKELDAIKDLAELIKSVQCAVHLLTIVNKQDLWWPKRDAVIRHYEDGSYGEVIKAIGSSKTKKTFTRSLKAVCLCQVNLKTIDDVVLAPTSAGYDTAIREVYLTHLLKELEQVVS
jgi:hypothetical protein